MAVYTPITPEQAAAFLTRYDLGAYAAHEGIVQGVSNSNFHLFTDRGRFILTLFEPRRVQAGDLPFFFSFANHLAEKGVACPAVFPDRDGNLFSELAGRPAAILEFMDGASVAMDALTPNHCAQAGTLSARMHLAAADFIPTRENTEGMERWGRMADLVQSYADDFEPGLTRILREELEFLQRSWPQDLQRGAVHADIFPDNVFFQDGTLCAVIDFYFSCTDAYAFDLSVTLNAWCFGRGDAFDPARGRAFLGAYQAVRPLAEAEKGALRVLCRGSAFRTLLSRLEERHNHEDGTLMQPHDPGAYLRRLRFHRENDVAAFL